MPDLDLQELKTIATLSDECRHAWWTEKTLAKALSTGDEPWHNDYQHIVAFNPPTALALIARIEELEAENERLTQDAKTVNEVTRNTVNGYRATIQRVHELHAREVIAVHEVGEEAWCPTCQQHYPCTTIKAIGDTK